MEHQHGMKTSSDNASLTGKLSDIEISVVRHDSAIHRMGSDLDLVKEDLNLIRDEVRSTTVILRERENNSSWVRGVAASLIILGVTNLGAVSWWASRTSLSVETLGEQLADLETRLRHTEKMTPNYHNNYRQENYPNNQRQEDQPRSYPEYRQNDQLKPGQN
jgi:hypothetical protein